MVVRPVLLRPPLPRRPSVNDFFGLPFHNSRRSTLTNCRCEGVVGLKVFSAMTTDLPASNSGRHVDPLARAEGDNRLLIIRATAEPAAKPLHFAADTDRVDRAHFDLEQPLDCRLDLAFRG